MKMFQFHFGPIQTYIKVISLFGFSWVSIPLWSDSNEGIDGQIAEAYGVSIPLWSDSNFLPIKLSPQQVASFNSTLVRFKLL